MVLYKRAQYDATLFKTTYIKPVHVKDALMLIVIQTVQSYRRSSVTKLTVVELILILIEVADQTFP
jgi:hypothetical protein